MSIRLKSLTLAGFRSFVDETTIDLDPAGLVLITGASGWGKSTICLAIAHALGFCPYPATELVSWGNATPLRVELVLDVANVTLRIRRGAPGLMAWIDGTQVRGGVKQIEERIQQLVGLSPEMLALLTYRAQRQPGLFLSKTDAEKKEFLTRLLNLDKFEAAIEATAATIRELERDVAVAMADRDRITGFMSPSDPGESVVDLELAITQALAKKELHSSKAISIRAQVRLLEKQRQLDGAAAAARFTSQLEAARWALADLGEFVPPPPQLGGALIQAKIWVKEIQERLQRLEEADVASQKASRTKYAELSAIASSLREEIAKKQGLVEQRNRLQAELLQLADRLCPTCKRTWDQTQDQADEVRLNIIRTDQFLLAIQLCEEELASTTRDLKAFPAWVPNPDIQRFQEVLLTKQKALAHEEGRQQESLSLARAKHQATVSEANTRIHALVAEQFAAITEAEGAVASQIDQLVKVAVDAEHLARAADIALSEATLRADRLKIQLEERKKFTAALDQTNASLVELTSRLAAEKDFLHLIGREGFLGSIFDEVLAEIADEANRILGTVTNTRHCTITFKTEVLTQKGVAKRTIVPVMNIAGNDAPLASGLSGGMLSTVELAVDLALGTVVSRRSGVSPGWLILDEVFEGLNTISKESCVEILSTYAQDRLVLVIDHATEFQGLFSKEIAVTHKEGRSFAQVR